MEEFSQILNDLILNSGLSLRQLAKESGVLAMQYSRYLNGSIPTIEVTIKIAEYFNCTIDYLFGLSKNKNDKLYKTYNYAISKFLERYNKLLEVNKISHYKFAQENVFDERIIRHWKAGVTPRLDNLYIIAKKLGGSIDELIGRY